MKLWVKIILVCLLTLLMICIFMLGWRLGAISKLREIDRNSAVAMMTPRTNTPDLFSTVFLDGGFSYYSD